MQTVELREAQTRLVELINSLTPGDEIAIAKDRKPVARLILIDATRPPRPLREFAGKFHSLPRARQDDVELHDREWCDSAV